MDIFERPNLSHVTPGLRGLVTAEELVGINAGLDDSYELVRGMLVVREPAGVRHGDVGRNLLVRLHSHVREQRLGKAFGPDVGFLLSRSPDTVRAPDVSFVRGGRLPPVLPSGFFDGAPDLAVEVLSPNDRFPLVEQKVWQYLEAGTVEVWVIHPERQTVTIRRVDGSAERLPPNGRLDGGEKQLVDSFRPASTWRRSLAGPRPTETRATAAGYRYAGGPLTKPNSQRLVRPPGE